MENCIQSGNWIRQTYHLFSNKKSKNRNKFIKWQKCHFWVRLPWYADGRITLKEVHLLSSEIAIKNDVTPIPLQETYVWKPQERLQKQRVMTKWDCCFDKYSIWEIIGKTNEVAIREVLTKKKPATPKKRKQLIIRTI